MRVGGSEGGRKPGLEVSLFVGELNGMGSSGSLMCNGRER